jgi:hypothetical protein
MSIPPLIPVELICVMESLRKRWNAGLLAEVVRHQRLQLECDHVSAAPGPELVLDRVTGAGDMDSLRAAE